MGHLVDMVSDDRYAAHHLFRSWVRKRHAIHFQISEYSTLGYGRRLKFNPLTADETHELITNGIDSDGGITVAFAEYLLEQDAFRAEALVKKYIGEGTYKTLSFQRRAVMMDIVWDAQFKVRKLRKLFNAVKRLDFELAVAELWEAEVVCFRNHIDTKAEVLQTGLLTR